MEKLKPYLQELLDNPSECSYEKINQEIEVCNTIIDYIIEFNLPWLEDEKKHLNVVFEIKKLIIQNMQNTPIDIFRVDKDWYFCVNQKTRETQYITINQIQKFCSEQVIKALRDKWTRYSWCCDVDCPHINSN